MSTKVRLSAFGATVVAVFAGSWALGAAVAPAGNAGHPADPGHHTDPPGSQRPIQSSPPGPGTPSGGWQR